MPWVISSQLVGVGEAGPSLFNGLTANPVMAAVR